MAQSGFIESEDLFFELFAETFGLDKLQYLVPEYPFEDIYGYPRRIDYALMSGVEKYALEIDGQRYHDPTQVAKDKFIDDLIRQNSLVYQGWTVYRWAYRQLTQSREQVKSELVQFLGHNPLLQLWAEFLPHQRAGEVASGDLELREHQAVALDELARLRREGKTLALLTHATGTGKTTTAVLDAKRVGLPVLFLAHTRELVEQAAHTFVRLWPEAEVTIEDGDGRRSLARGKESLKRREGCDAAGSDEHEKDVFAGKVTVSSVQYVSRNLSQYAPEQFGYLVIDEAHHATSRTYKEVIGHFKTRFLLGLTATPERMDGQSLLDIFQHVAHRMDLKTAIELGELVPIRCVRVKTNVDLSSVRFNGFRYQAKDLEEKLRIPERDRLIVQTYLELTPGERAVVFCVNVAHAERLAELFCAAGVEARSVSGRQSRVERQQILSDYGAGAIQVLCACDILNEGWDSPETRVLLMARPTLSKVIYLQQLGRGTRKAPGKESLLVVDFVDNGNRYNQGVSLHRLFKIREYMAGRLALAPVERIAEERAAWEATRVSQDLPEAFAHLHLWLKDIEVVDLFDWQHAIEHMWSHRRLAMELGVSDDTVINWVRKGKVVADHVVPLGKRTFYYFEPERAEEIRRVTNTPPRLPIYDEFFLFVRQADRVFSYKPVLLAAMIELADTGGRVGVDRLVERFASFYQERQRCGLPVEAPKAKMARIENLTNDEIRVVLFEMPFEKFERKGYFRRCRELTEVEWHPSLWAKLTVADKATLLSEAELQIEDYYSRRVAPKR
ncbi:DEAD/DEAH box helicase family protein [Heliobacterium gestii]|uniref:DEAD/DEAH box helicase family protein n=1 Tax=Heliomicrobium gestii TaxID=2699 RepID=A0A845LCM6_HELGE|nr:DEAD/DEAH box helicase family protein [Heliomicrobium gestii]MBM7865987.1 superfamily II DNA or RNA helicase [Heliomicrobium gestii]MZP42680.1 DEAD/DEAH box helicase family protein [Heliomicrobium gestii]